MNHNWYRRVISPPYLLQTNYVISLSYVFVLFITIYVVVHSVTFMQISISLSAI